jgi:hypothetical protein
MSKPHGLDVDLVGVSHGVSCSIVSLDYRQWPGYAHAWECVGMAWAITYTLLGDSIQPIFKGQPEQGLAMARQGYDVQWFCHCRRTGCAGLACEAQLIHAIKMIAWISKPVKAC